MSAWAIRHPDHAVGAVRGVVLSRRGRLHPAADQSDSGHLVPDGERGDRSAGRRARPKWKPRSPKRSKARSPASAMCARMNTHILEGSVVIEVEFEIGTPIDRAVTDVRDAVSKVRNDLPQGIMEPLVQRLNVDGGAIAYYAVTTTSRTPAEAQLVHRQHHHQAAVDGAGRGPGLTQRRRQPRDPRGSRSRRDLQALGAHGLRGQ